MYKIYIDNDVVVEDMDQDEAIRRFKKTYPNEVGIMENPDGTASFIGLVPF